MSSEPIAVVGMACVFPGAPDLATYWDNIVRGVDAIGEVPPERWDPVFYEPDSHAVDRFYCKRGGFVDAHATFDPLRHGVMPVAAKGAEPDQLLALEVASRALEDAACVGERLPRERAAVILGRGNYIGAGMTRLAQHVRTAQQLVESLRTLVPGLSEAQLAEVKADFQGRLGLYGPDTAIGLVPNLTASRVANRLDLNGPAYTVDAACASALVAIDQACAELRGGRADLALAGGIHLSHDVAFWSVFCQLGALSRSSTIRPFHADADGLLIGEGVGIVALKRLADAERDGDRIYCAIRGTGVASDGRTSLMNPDVNGQTLALKRAWADAGLDPESVGLIEAHGTATPAGDAAELDTLRRFFGPAPSEAARAGLGSVKSMIGHAMPAAGAAGFIKAALAVYHGVLPPSLHCDTPAPGLAATRFRVIAEAEPWSSVGPRVAGVNAFGFGGINAHTVLESVGRKPALGAGVTPVEQVALFAAADPRALLGRLDADARGGEGGCRLAVADPTPERLARARALVEKGKPRRGRDGVWFSPGGLLLEGKVAFVFPGVEGVFEPRLERLPAALAAAVRGRPGATELERQGAGVMRLGEGLDRLLRGLGLRPDAVAGHSVGEWGAMIAAGMLPEAAVRALVTTLEPGSLEVPDVVFISAGCGAEKARAVLAGLRLEVSLDNCPRQVVLCGPEADGAEALERLREARVLAQRLPFRSGFHSPALEAFLAPHSARIRQLDFDAPSIPVWSATRAGLFPAEPEAARALAIEHLVRPVRFRELVEAMYADGFRAFVQVGSGSLVGFVGDTLRGQPHLAISANAPQRDGLAQLRRAAAALFVEGADLDLLAFDALAARPGGMTLQLGVPLVRLERTLDVATAGEAPAPDDPLGQAFHGVLAEVRAAQETVRRALDEPARELRLTRTLSAESAPWLLDHCLFPQPAGWPNVEDHYPVVPMTMSIEMVLQAARAAAPDRVAVAVEAVRAYKWLAVEPPVEAEIVARREGDVVQVEIKGALRARVRLAERYPEPPPPALPPLEAPEATPIDAAALYAEGYMFHGPAYQGVAELAGHDRGGIDGTLVARPAEGALLDNAGQLLGYWIMEHTTEDRLGMPVKVDRIELFGPQPPADARLPCRVRVEKLGRREVRADLELLHEGRIWCRIEGWEDWRFDTDERLWPLMRQPDRHLLAEPQPEGWVLVKATPRSQRSWDYLGGRFLSAAERAEMAELAPPRRRSWLLGRVAAKDAARDWARRNEDRRLYPVQVRVTADEEGRPEVSGEFEGELRVSIAHSGERAVALVSAEGAPGVDLEAIEPRSDTLVRAAFAEAELALLGDRPRDEWLTRLWAAKEALAKATGVGLGSPRKWRVSAIDGERLRVSGGGVEGVWVATRVVDEDVVAWVLLEE